MKFNFNEVDSSWRDFFQAHEENINQILEQLESTDISPSRSEVFRAFKQPLKNIRVVIIGQDPYPGERVADGLAFSSQPHNPIPASLRNIFLEYCSDLGLERPTTPDLSAWNGRGVMLLNRALTTSVGERNAHANIGWFNFTEDVARLLADRDVIAMLWGNQARELAHIFRWKIESAHPSPLSVRRGFFGSRPFSTTNSLLKDLGREPIDWSL